MSRERIVIAGGGGFLGGILARRWNESGPEVVMLSRSPQLRNDGAREIFWDARSLGDWAATLNGASALINFTGRTVNCRYNEKNRRQILDSRVLSTRVLGQAIAQCPKPPAVWLNASTATIYKHTFGNAWDESGEIGATPEAKDEFSVQVAQAWEEALREANTPSTRKVALRTAMVLGLHENSVFPMLRRLVRLGLGGRMGSGDQFVSWIHEEDFCRAIEWLIARGDLDGVVNVAAPNPVTNREMMQIFREVIRVPVGLPAASWMLELGAIFLRTETELIIKSRRVVPARLVASGFDFRFSEMMAAVREIQDRSMKLWNKI
jgi:uncharacterized protein (TIGR01777 family)